MSTTNLNFDQQLELPAWARINVDIRRADPSLPRQIQPQAPVKWGVSTQAHEHQPSTWLTLKSQLLPIDRDPQRNDVLVARVVELGRNRSIELSSGRKSELYLGDVIVGAFGNRYATNQYEAHVPARQEYYHMLSQGAVFGQVLSASYSTGDPTVVEPLGFMDAGGGQVLNLSHRGLRPIANVGRVPTLLVLGASMDAGKTTTAANLVHGLALAGWHVNAGKLTGTGCAKDVNKMLDAGARKVLDFTACGFASTAGATDEELDAISSRMIEHLSLDAPDLLVLEIADGIVQSETRRLTQMLVQQGKVDGAIMAIHDVLSADTAEQIVEREFGLPLFAMAGAATRSPLSTLELRSVTNLPVYDMAAISDATVALAVDDFLKTRSLMSRSSVAVV
ncbi:MAG: hypothetical protein KDB14_07275 [Planctomycetales bacterium]|nr:hypothetical protein [Planctomycetales bacterium]